ncbi:MAG: UxaA family hydrolase [Acutalibacteraceae bacterium]
MDAQTATTDDLFNLILRTANGQQTQNERHGYREIAIFKDGVTL